MDATVPAITLPMQLDPLTGLAPADPSLLERRPLAIKVANYRPLKLQCDPALTGATGKWNINTGSYNRSLP